MDHLSFTENEDLLAQDQPDDKQNPEKRDDYDHENAKDSRSLHNDTMQGNDATISNASTCPFAIALTNKPQQHLQSPHFSPSSTESSPSFSYTAVPAPAHDNTLPMSHHHNQITAAHALQLAKEACPAFQSSCPFRNIQDEKSMRAALQSLPPSHLSFRDSETVGKDHALAHGKENEIGELVKVALAHVHTVSRHLDIKAGGSTAATATAATDRNKSSSETKTLYNETDAAKSQNTHALQKNYGKSASFADEMERFSLFGLMGKLIQEELGIQPQTEDESKGTVDVLPHQGAVATNAAVESTKTYYPMKRNVSTTSLSQALKQGTKESHSAAESVHFVKEFIKGNIDRTLYSHLICNLYHLYRELERLLDDYAPTCFDTLHFPKELKRTEALKDDVDFFLGERSRMGGSGIDDCARMPSRATLDYIARLEYIAQHEPLLLLSHAYTRYLGDLSGGKILARVAKRAMNLQQDDSGLKFYQFENIPSAKLFKDQYRKALDELILTEEQIERLVAEANVAFVLNMRIFEELDVLNEIEGSAVRDYECATVYYDECVKKQKRRKDGVLDANDRGIEDGNIFLGQGDHGMEQRKEGQTKCPFAVLGATNPHKVIATQEEDGDGHSDQLTGEPKSKLSMYPSTKTATKQGRQVRERCPWPFVFFHDPHKGMKDYQTW
eukprot:CAMPEP_0176502500 /NCGR_PEP_ID=MMETSP0200_2-20121128/14788_1 /TAXON_ID=947934 /ORGANISM="Chaetoceros sp., Strain GSL56" /LENGTH=670 /DNA_ID=CAMNT_0017901579 /DNA_START=155 /DNA_END=2164 /DNA_ORIENTATION=+